MGIEHDDEAWMALALKEAEKAKALGEVPVGAVLVKDNQLITSGHNKPITDNDPSAHAEMVVLRQAGKLLNNYRLNETTLYVTLEPCTMCAGLLVHARIKRLVFGAVDPKAGAIQSVNQLLTHSCMNHEVQVTGGVLAQQCSQQLSSFFASRRLERKQSKTEGDT